MRLPDFITKNMEAILDEWETFAREIKPARRMNRKDLRDHAKQMLETIARDLNTPQTVKEQDTKSKGEDAEEDVQNDEQTASKEHASGRASAGFSIEEMISEYRALRASVLRLWRASCDSAGQSELDDMTRFNEGIDQAVAESVEQYSSDVKRAQDLFLGILGHDLRNPLGAITMSASFLMQDVTLAAKHIKAASIIYSSGTTMSLLINDLLDFTRTRLGQSMPISPSATNLADIVEQTVMQIRAFHPDHTIVFGVDGDGCGNWDPARIGQVFSNLLGNAVRHGASNESINVNLSGLEKDVIVTVHNGGTPIPESEIPHIFDALRLSGVASIDKSRDSGLGLGLYISQEIITAHGGMINATSSKENGTTFTVRLPRQYTSP